MATPKPRANDLTGIKAAELAEQHKQELAERESEISLVNQVRAELKDEAVDATGTRPVEIVDDVEIVASPEDETEVIRPLEDIEDATIGTWNGSLNAGQKYTVPKNVADELRWRGRLDNRL